jgi:hypothetical protein
MKLAPYDIRKILRGNRTTNPADDFRLIDSWAEYDENGNETENERPLNFLCYEIETMDPETGETLHVYKALKFARVLRLPKDSKQSTSLMDMHSQILSGAYEQGYNLVTVIANIIDPVPLGLLYLYGVQGVASTAEEAKRKAADSFFGLVGMLQGTYRVLHLRNAVAQEAEWLREKMYSMDYLTMVRGIPKASKEGENIGNKGMGGSNLNPNSQGTLEEIITGMVDYEYVIQILATPVYMSTLKAWSRRTQMDMTDWNSQLQGTKSVSMNLSMPMMYMANASQSQGWSQALTDADSVSYTQGESFTTGIGESVSQSISETFGQSFGRSIGTTVTDSVSQSHSVSQGSSIGQTLGVSEGISSNFGTSFNEGNSASHSVGTSQSTGSSANQSQSTGTSHSAGTSIGESLGKSFGQSHTVGNGQNWSESANSGANQGVSNSHNFGTSQGTSLSGSEGTSHGVGTNQSSSIGQNQSTSVGESSSWSQGNSVSQTVGQSVTTGSSSSVSEGQSNSISNGSSNSVSNGSSQSLTDGTSSSVSNGNSTNWSNGVNNSNSTGTSMGNTETNGTSTNDSNGHTTGTGTSDSTGNTTTDSTNHSNNSGWNNSTNNSVTGSVSTGGNIGLPFGIGSVNASASVGGSTGSSKGVSGGTSDGFSFSDANSVTSGTSTNVSDSETHGTGTSNSNSVNTGSSQSTTNGTSSSQGGGTSFSETNGTSQSQTNGTSQSQTNGTSQSESNGTSSSVSSGTSQSQSNSVSYGQSQSNSVGGGSSYSNSVGSSFTQSDGTSENWGVSSSNGWGENYGINEGYGTNESWGVSEGLGVSQGNSLSESFAASEGSNESQSIGSSLSDGYTQGFSEGAGTNKSSGTSIGDTTGTSFSNGVSQSEGTSSSRSSSNSFSQNSSFSDGVSRGKSVGQSQSESTTQSYSNGTSQGVSNSQSVSSGQSSSRGTSESHSLSQGTSGTFSTGSSASMGLGPSVGYNKSYQWLDQQVKDILELLEYQNERIKQALRGSGAFYTYVYIACGSADALSTAMALAKSTWHNEFAMTQPIQVIELNEESQRHLLYHFSAFSADVTREYVAGAQEYKYATVLLPNEYVAYTHLPRVSEGGIFAETEDVPKFAVPSMLKGEIYMGSVLSGERYSFKNGYRTPYDYRITESELMHGFFTGASRSGKTVAAMRFVAELSKVRRSRTGKKLRIVCMDPKKDWRALARFVEPERFRFFSMANPDFHPLKLNPCKIPRGVTPQIWIDALIEVYCRAYGLLERGKQLMGETFYSLYEEAGVFDAQNYDGWETEVPRLSASVTFTKAYEKMSYYKRMLEDPSNPKGRGGNDTRDAYARLLERLSAFGRPFSIESKLFGSSEGLGVDEMIGNDDVTVIESKGLESTFKNFIFGVITSGFFRYAIAHEDGYLAPDQYETVLVIEEANEVLTGNDSAGGKGGQQFGLTGQSEFEQVLDQAAGYGLFIIAITQKIADMPKSIIANSGLVFAGKVISEDDVNVIVKTLARDPRYDNRDFAKWFPRSPIGWFVCRSSRTTTFTDAEPVLVQIAMLNVKAPSNVEINEMLTQRDAIKKLAARVPA